MRQSRQFPRHQGGAALLMITTLILLAFGVYSLSQLSPNQHKLNKQSKILERLNIAIAAIRDYRLVNSGDVPCPDSNNDGLSDSSACSQLGDLPWKSLQIAKLNDPIGKPFRYQIGKTISIDGKTDYLAVVIASMGGSLEGENADGDMDFVTTEGNDWVLGFPK